MKEFAVHDKIVVYSRVRFDNTKQSEVLAVSHEQLDENDLASIASLSELEQVALRCKRCGLRDMCSQVVFGEGNADACVMLVGEAPGAQEDMAGRPFVGTAGRLLDNLLEVVGFSRETVYITNIAKCRPVGNRIPTTAEASSCLPILSAQIRIISPKIIVCLGALATRTLISQSARITRCRGQWVEKDGIFYMPTYHPAALLRDPAKKRPVWEDFKTIRAKYENICEMNTNA